MSSLHSDDPVRSYRELLDTLPIVAYIARPDGTLAYVSQAWVTEFGLQPEEILDRNYAEYIFPEDRDRAISAFRLALSTVTPYRDETRVRFGDGSYHWVLSQALPIRSADATIAGWFGMVTVIDDRKRSEQGLRLLSATGAAAVRSLHYLPTLNNFVEAVTGEFASYCIIDIEDAEHPWERIAKHRDPQLSRKLRSLPKPVGHHPIALALAGGEAQAITIDDAWLHDVNANIDRAALVRGFGVRSVIIVPIRAPSGEVLGAITAGLDRTDRTGRIYTDADVPFLEEVARRAGASIVNARLYERQRRIALELQAASLPSLLPARHGVVLDAYYRPGSDEATIGGDWYDAFELDDGRIVMTVGDVRGHGLRAAVEMTKLRQAVQAAAMVSPNPSIMLAVADRTIRLLDADSYATALVAVFDPDTSTLEVASAGHPPPLIAYDGGVDEVDATGIMLGLGDGGGYPVRQVSVPPGAAIVLYTDGLVEATRDLDAGLAKLRDALRRDDVLHGATPAESIVNATLGRAAASDDIAVLVARVDPMAVVRHAARPLAPSAHYEVDSSDAAGAHAVRRAFVAFVDELAGDRIDVAAAELVLGELLGNVTRHAGGVAVVQAAWKPDGLDISVRNAGSLFALNGAAHGPSDPLAESGRGLALIYALARDVHVRSSPDGMCDVRARVPFERNSVTTR